MGAHNRQPISNRTTTTRAASGRSRYSYYWPTKDFTDLAIEQFMIRKGGYHFADKHWRGLPLWKHYRAMMSILWPADDHHRWSDLALQNIVENRVTVIIGPKDCVSGDTKILDLTTGVETAIRDLEKRQIAPMVMTLNGAAKAEVPFIRGVAQLIELTLANGQTIKCTTGHRLLGPTGFVRAGGLNIGDALLTYGASRSLSTEGFCRSIHPEDVRRWMSTGVGSQSGYPFYPCSHDAQLLTEEASCQGVPPLPVGVPKREFLHSCTWDDLACRSSRSRFSTESCRRAISGSFPLSRLAEISTESPLSGQILGCASDSFQSSSRFCTEVSCYLSKERAGESDALLRRDVFGSHRNDVVQQTVVQSKRLVGFEPFYDITVPTQGHYFAEGLIHHNCGKTTIVAKFALCDYWTFPEETLWMISTTDYRSAELRIWGAIKEHYNRAKTLFPDLPGHVLDSMRAITTGQIDDDQQLARSLRKGMILVPCRKGTQYVGLSAFIGAKSPRLRHAGDEVSLMSEGFLDAYANWEGDDKDFKGLMTGNPTDLLDPLCKAAKPVGGWESMVDTQKTQTWKSTFFNAAVVCFDGRDSPNNDFPDDQGPKYKYLITRKAVQSVVRSFGPESWQAYMQAYGKPNRALTSKRVITEQLCKQHKALEEVVWRYGGRKLVYGLDPAFGGGDRCVGVPGEFGEDITGKMVLRLGTPEIIPVSVASLKEPEDQIAEFLRTRLYELNIPTEHCYYDSHGKGTLGFAFSRLFGSRCPVPVDSGGNPTARPVRHDLYKTDPDGTRRLVRADEYYSKRVSELWYNMRIAIECEQIRELNQEMMEEGCVRIFKIVKGHKVEVESKDDMKERTQGKSPDLFDAATFTLWAAVEKGFRVERLGHTAESTEAKYTEWNEMADDRYRAIASRQLQLN